MSLPSTSFADLVCIKSIMFSCCSTFIHPQNSIPLLLHVSTCCDWMQQVPLHSANAFSRYTYRCNMVGVNAPSIFIIPLNSFFGYWVEEGQLKKGIWVGGKGCMYMKIWFRPIFPLCQTSLPLTPPNVISQVMPADTCDQLGGTCYPHVQVRSVMLEVACSSKIVVPLYPTSDISSPNLEDGYLNTSGSDP